MKKKIITIGICLIILVSLASAQTGNSLKIEQGRLIDDFEDNDIVEYDKIRTEADWQTTTEQIYNGSYSLKAFKSNTAFGLENRLRSNDSMNISKNESFTVTFAMWKGPKSHFNQNHGVRITDLNGTTLNIYPSDARQSEEFTVSGSLVSSFIRPTGISVPGGKWFTVTVEVDYESNETRAYLNDTLIGTTNISQTWNSPNNIHIAIIADLGSGNTENTWYMYYDDIKIESEGFGKTLQLNVNKYMEYGETQSYSVKLNNNGILTDVSDSATITSSNASLITVDNTNNTLIATSNKSRKGVVEIKAEYVGLSNTKDVTIANATLENIDDLPNTKWIKAFSGFEEASSNYGLGSEIQWIFFIIIMMVTFTHLANKWVGIGIGEILLILFWITQYISLGVFLGSMVFGILLLLTQVNQSQTVTYESRSPPENF